MSAITSGSSFEPPSFSTRFRGVDPVEVRAFLAEQQNRIDELERDKASLAGRLEQLGETTVDFDSFSQELRQILEAAHRAADSLRERATTEVTSWRETARAEVATSLSEASADAENLRRDAWTASQSLVEQSQVESKSAVEDAARDALAIVGKAEREAHRLQSTARREAEEVMRLSRMEAERVLVEARAQHDDILEQARVTTDAAQERARALEVRRSELLTELDSVQVAVARLEDDLQKKRDALAAVPEVPEPPAPVASTAEATEVPKNEWDTETIKLIPASKSEPEPESELVDASEMAEEVRRLNEPEVTDDEDTAEVEITEGSAAEDGDEDTFEDAFEEPEAPAAPIASFGGVRIIPAPATTDDELDVEADDEAPSGGDRSTDATPDPTVTALAVAATDDALGGLFASLREPDDLNAALASAPDTKTSAASESEPVPVEQDVATIPALPAVVDASEEALDLREQLLLPIMNRVLRDVKRQLTESQNLALEQLRTASDEWEPDVGDLTELVHGDLTILAQESFAAGYDAVEVMTGESPGRPKSQKSDIPNRSGEFAEALANDLVKAAAKSDAPRAASSAVSRVYRGWRTDTAERRVRGLARAAYHRGIVRALGVLGTEQMAWAVAGRGCADCRTVAEAGPVDPRAGFADKLVPPLHPECSCTVVTVN